MSGVWTPARPSSPAAEFVKPDNRPDICPLTSDMIVCTSPVTLMLLVIVALSVPFTGALTLTLGGAEGGA